MSLQIKRFVFNAFQVNTYVVYHPNGDALVVDPACYTAREQEELEHFLKGNSLNIKYVVNTHSHVDHVLGNGFLAREHNVIPMIHKAGIPFYHSMTHFANSYGFELDNPVMPEEFLEEGDDILLGDQIIKVAYSPGHANGSICLVYEAGKWIITGDLVFHGSIGRTDLPTGNLELLLSSVRRVILPHADDFVLYPGHGQQTTVGFERRNNPFL